MPAWAVAMSASPVCRWSRLVATIDGEPGACAIVLDHHGDAALTAVATLPEHRGKGLAGWIITELLESARERGLAPAACRPARPARRSTSDSASPTPGSSSSGSSARARDGRLHVVDLNRLDEILAARGEPAFRGGQVWEWLAGGAGSYRG